MRPTLATVLTTLLTVLCALNPAHCARCADTYEYAENSLESVNHSLPLLTSGTRSALTTLELGLLARDLGHPCESIHSHHYPAVLRLVPKVELSSTVLQDRREL